MYEILYNETVKHNADASFCGSRREIRPGKFICSNECSEVQIWEDGQISNLYLNMIASSPNEKRERLYEMSVWRSLYKKSIIAKYNLSFMSEREWASEDLPFNVQYLSKCRKVILLPNILHIYCINPTSLTKTYHKEKFQRFANLYYWLVKETSNVDPNKIHSSRFLIGYTRAHIKSLISSRLPKKEKIKILRGICYNQVWDDMNYDLLKLPYYAAICQYLLQTKNLGFYMPFYGFLFI